MSRAFHSDKGALEPKFRIVHAEGFPDELSKKHDRDGHELFPNLIFSFPIFGVLNGATITVMQSTYLVAVSIQVELTKRAKRGNDIGSPNDGFA